jgi:hypothetical protein
MTQKELILEFIKEHGSIIPAKEHGITYKDGFLGSETSKRCREMRQVGLLESEPWKENTKFEIFYLKGIRKINAKPQSERQLV